MFNADKHAKAFENEIDKVIGDKIKELEERIKILEKESNQLKEENIRLKMKVANLNLQNYELIKGGK